MSGMLFISASKNNQFMISWVLVSALKEYLSVPFSLHMVWVLFSISHGPGFLASMRQSYLSQYNYFLFWSVVEEQNSLIFLLGQRYSIPFSSKLNFSSSKGKLTSPTFYHMHYWGKLKSNMLKSSLGEDATEGTGLTKFCCSVAKSCLTLWYCVDDSTPSFPVLHCLPEFAQIHVHWVGDAIQPPHPLSSPSPALFLLVRTFPRQPSHLHIPFLLP